MALVKQTTPYELLFRLKPDGTVASHARFRTQILEDGETVHDTEGHALTLVQAAAAGFPLETILNELQIATATELETKKEELATTSANLQTKTAELEQKTTELTTTTAKVTQLEAKVVELEAALEEATKPPPETPIEGTAK